MELDGAFAGTSDLIDTTRNLRIADISLIGGIVEDQRIVFQRVVHPLPQLLFRNHRSRWVVGVTQIDHVHVAVLGNAGRKAVLSRTGHIHHVCPASVLEGAASAYHHVGVDIDGIDRVGHADEVIPVQQLLNVSCIRLRTVVDKHLVDVEMDATWQKIVLQDRLTQESDRSSGSPHAGKRSPVRDHNREIPLP